MRINSSRSLFSDSSPRSSLSKVSNGRNSLVLDAAEGVVEAAGSRGAVGPGRPRPLLHGRRSSGSGLNRAIPGGLLRPRPLGSLHKEIYTASRKSRGWVFGRAGFSMRVTGTCCVADAALFGIVGRRFVSGGLTRELRVRDVAL